MNYEELIELINHLDQSSLAFMDYQTDNEHLILSKEVPQMALQQADIKTIEAVQPTNTPVETVVIQEAALEESNAGEAIKEVEEKDGEIVESPMVGVIYLQAHPDEDPYVKVGDRVEKGDVICIVEAMKLMNEIQAPRSGVVTEILVENEDVVEYKQPLIRID